ncbi:MAG: hypothetical protein HFJ41_02810 [Clostridia bacterium]|nr:hypothetical protein [Clostridia bacterium]
MNHILQNVKSGFANMKELFGIFISVDENSDGYDLYINSKDTELSQIAKVLKDSEEKQEAKRFSVFTDKQPKRNTKSTKKNFKSSPSDQGKASHKKISNDEHIREGIEPEI